MNKLRVAMVEFEITPHFHPKFDAWGTTPSVTKIDLEAGDLYARRLALELCDSVILEPPYHPVKTSR